MGPVSIMYGRNAIEARIIAVGVGGGVAFIVGPLLSIAVRSEWLLNCSLALVYAPIAAVVAFRWPQLSWRTGLWFFVFLPPTILVSFFFTGAEVPINWRAELTSLSGYALGLVGACFGGWVGAAIGMRRGKQVPRVKEHS